MIQKMYRILAIVLAILVVGIVSTFNIPAVRAQETQTPTLGARYYHAAVYNETSDRMIITAGTGRIYDETFNDTWVLMNASGKNGAARWECLKPTGQTPAGRSMAGAVYNQSSNRMILFGGQQAWFYSNEVWVLAGADGSSGQPEWIQLHPTGVPPAEREGIFTVYNSGSNRLITIGGGAMTSIRNDVWLLINADGTGGTPEWRLVSPNGTCPYFDEDSILAYNSYTNRITGYGVYLPTNDNSAFPYKKSKDIWVLDNADCTNGSPMWTQITPQGIPPDDERYLSAVYNKISNRMIFYSGDSMNYSAMDHTGMVWVLLNADGTTGIPEWLKLSSLGTIPGLRYGDTAVLDSGSNRMIIFGGRGNTDNGLYTDVWILTDADGTGGNAKWQRGESLSVVIRNGHNYYSSKEEGKTEKIQWNVSGGNGPYSISLEYRWLTEDHNAPWITIATNMQNSMQYLWKVPNREKAMNGNNIELRITARDNSIPSQSVSESIEVYITEQYSFQDLNESSFDIFLPIFFIIYLIVLIPLVIYLDRRKKKWPLEKRMEQEDLDTAQLKTAEKNIMWARAHPDMGHSRNAVKKLKKAADDIKDVEEKSVVRIKRLEKTKELLKEVAPHVLEENTLKK
jgi:hypothetical protein